MSRVARLPVRVRLTLVLAGVVAILLGLGGLYSYLKLGEALGDSIEQNLRARTADLTPRVRRGEPLPAPDEENFAEVGGARLTADQRRRAQRGPIFVDSERGGDAARLLVTPVDGRLLVVGTAADDRSEALRTLAVLLLIGGPVAIVIASLAGYGAAEARLRAALERERAFVADASHELRTPLAILKAELELASRAGRSREELEAAVRSAAEETDRLAALAEDLLVIARVDDGALPIRAAELRVADVLETVAARFPGRARADAPAALRVDADPDRLQQALGNLVDNALRHGGTHAELAAERVDGRVELHVRDDGPGFPPTFLDDAFDRFTRADAARGRGGAGLGLAIVDVIARAHGGEARARNRPAGGADVWISLPCAS
jgi:two-component system, OmpR family, sensor kinase